jgi:hypothetical protein
VDPEKPDLSARGSESLRPWLGEHQRKGAIEPRAAMPRDDLDHQHRANDAAELKLVWRWAFDADLGHRRGGALVLVGGHRLAGVDKDALADSGLKSMRRGAVLDIFPSMNHGPCPRLPDRNRPLWLTHRPPP